MGPDDPILARIASEAERHGTKPAARLLGISATLVRRAMRIHGVKPRPAGWHMSNKQNGKLSA